MKKILVSDLALEPTDGKPTLVQVCDGFDGYVGGMLTPLNVPSPPTGALTVEIYQLTEKTQSGDIYTSFGKEPKDLCIAQSQIIQFFQRYQKHMPQESRTLFLINVRDQFFILPFRRGILRSSCGVNPDPPISLLKDWKWGTDCQLVVPKQP
jgi:hypothetical protein